MRDLPKEQARNERKQSKRERNWLSPTKPAAGSPNEPIGHTKQDDARSRKQAIGNEPQEDHRTKARQENQICLANECLLINGGNLLEYFDRWFRHGHFRRDT